MAVVRVVIWDEVAVLQRISTPEDTFLIEAIDASGSDDNILKIGPAIASGVMVGHDEIGTFVSGVLSGNFITGTFYGDGSQLRGVVTTLNDLTGSVQLVAGTNVQITSGSGQITISAVSGALSSDELVKVSSNDTLADYLYNKVSAGPNMDVTEVNDGGNESLQLAANVTSINGYSGSVDFLEGPNTTITSGSNQITLQADVTSVNGFSGSVDIVPGPNMLVGSGSGEISLTASVTSIEGLSGTIDLVAGPFIEINSAGPPNEIAITGSNAFGTEYQVTSSLDIQTNSTTAFQEALFLSGNFENTVYYIGWSCEMTNGSNNYDVLLRVLLNGDTADSLNETNAHFRTADTWSAQSAFREITVPSGSNTISIEFASEFAAKVAKVRRLHIITWRVL